MRLTFISILCLLQVWLTSNAQAQSADVIHASQLFANSKEIDFARTKLEFDKIVDPSINVEATLAELDDMVLTIKGMMGATPSAREKYFTLKKFIYESGEWNDHRPFHYDMKDPLGTKLENKLLTNYIRTRKGNCVSMPALFLILGDRIGLNVTLSTAPFHVFVKYKNPEGKTVNLETTSGAHLTRDSWYQKLQPFSPIAVKSGIYLKTHNRQQSAALLGHVVLEYFTRERRYYEAFDLSSHLLSVNDMDIHAILTYGSSAGRIMDIEFKGMPPQLIQASPGKRGRYEFLVTQNMMAFQTAEKAGWREEKPIAAPPIK